MILALLMACTAPPDEPSIYAFTRYSKGQLLLNIAGTDDGDDALPLAPSGGTLEHLQIRTAEGEPLTPLGVRTSGQGVDVALPLVASEQLLLQGVYRFPSGPHAGRQVQLPERVDVHIPPKHRPPVSP